MSSWISVLALTSALAFGLGCNQAAPCPVAPALPSPFVEPPSASPLAKREQREGFDVLPDAEAAAGLDPALLAKIRTRAAKEKSAALIIIQDGHFVVEDYFGGSADRARMAMSVTKSVVALGLGGLVEDKLLALDAPLSEKLFPELAKSDKAGITLRHLMNHTSGLPTKRAGSDGASWAKASIEKHVLDQPLETPIGSKFVYNNNAVDFLSAVVRRASPEIPYLDDLLHFTLFEKLGVHSVSWMKDGRGDPRASGELMIRPIDLAKIGQVVLEGGTFRGKKIVSPQWVKTLLEPGQAITDECGLLWWRDGVPGDKGVKAYRADGYLGQYIIVVPSARLVAVRMRDGRDTSWKPEEFSYKDFRLDVMALAGISAASPPKP